MMITTIDASSPFAQMDWEEIKFWDTLLWYADRYYGKHGTDYVYSVVRKDGSNNSLYDFFRMYMGDSVGGGGPEGCVLSVVKDSIIQMLNNYEKT
jgi:hypothetical protein